MLIEEGPPSDLKYTTDKNALRTTTNTNVHKMSPGARRGAYGVFSGGPEFAVTPQ